METGAPSLMKRIAELRPTLTPKGRILADYVLMNPAKAVFLRTRELAKACAASEATVVRFVNRLGFDGYPHFIQALRDHIDTGLTMIDRVELAITDNADADRLSKVISQEIDNLRKLYETLDPARIKEVAEVLIKAEAVYVGGSRLSYTYAYYLGLAMTKIRNGIQILSGSDSLSFDWMNMAPPGSVVVLAATSRYPNELIRLAKFVRRLDLPLVVISDSALCPVSQFATISLVAPSRHIPIVGSPCTLVCLMNCIVYEMIAQGGEPLRTHQEKLEQNYRENDIFFNLDQITTD